LGAETIMMIYYGMALLIISVPIVMVIVIKAKDRKNRKEQKDTERAHPD